jgi:hypothetical protein
MLSEKVENKGRRVVEEGWWIGELERAPEVATVAKVAMMASCQIPST